jgi:hypothetical protein
MINSAQSTNMGRTLRYLRPAGNCTQKLHQPDHNLSQHSRISTNTTPPSSQGRAPLKKSLTGRGLCTVSLAIRQPLGPGFFARGLGFPPRPSGLTEADVFAEAGLFAETGLVEAPRLTASLTPALALFLFHPAVALAAGLAADLAAEGLAAEGLATEGLAAEDPAPDLDVDAD